MKLPRFSKNVITKRHSQRGDFLIESLIGVLLIGIVGVGIARTATQVTKSQVQSQEQAQIISKLQGIASGGLESKICGGADILEIASSKYTQELTYKSDTSCTDGAIKTLNLSIAGEVITTKQPLVMNVTITEGEGDEKRESVLRVGQISE